MIAGLLKQQITRYTKTGYDKYGHEVVSTGTTINCRFQKVTERQLMPNGNLMTIDAICYVPADTTVATDDKINFEDNDYKVFSINHAIDGSGQTHHIKLELVKWQT